MRAEITTAKTNTYDKNREMKTKKRRGGGASRGGNRHTTLPRRGSKAVNKTTANLFHPILDFSILLYNTSIRQVKKNTFHIFF
jgi:hypothetical protein